MAGQILPDVVFRFEDSSGNPISGGTATFYLTGTTTLTTIYADASLQTVLPNPISTNSAGLFINGANQATAIYFSPSITYRGVFKNAVGTVIRDIDPIAIIPSSSDLTFIQSGAGAVSRTLQNKMRESVSVADYGATGDGLTDDTAAIIAAVAGAGFRPLYFPPGTYVITSTITFTPTVYLSSFGAGPFVFGAGEDKTFFDNRVAGGAMFYVDSNADHSTTFRGVLGSVFRDFTIITTTSPADSIGVYLQTSYQVTVERVHVNAINGDGIKIPTLFGDLDGSNQILLRHCRIENCTGWGINAKGTPPYNETSFIKMEQCFIQSCGTNEFKTITGITQANPAVVTAAGHGFSTGDVIKIYAVVGMTEVNLNTYSVGATTANTFQLAGVDSTGFSAYASGGEAAPKIASSGGMIWTGQVLSIEQCAWTINKNAALLIPGQAGASQSLYIENTAFENNHKRSFYCTGITNVMMNIVQFYNNTSNPGYVACEFDGADYSVEGVVINNPIVRVQNLGTAYTAFRIGGANTVLDSCRINTSVASWDNYDWPLQTRFDGWRFAPIVQTCELAVDSATNMLFRPNQSLGRGNTTPLRLRGPNNDPSGAPGTASTTGEWVVSTVPNGGVLIPSAGLTVDTIYYFYVYDNGGSLAVNISTTAPAIDAASGYLVKSTDATMLYIGRGKTDPGSSIWIVSNMAWLNPTVIPGSQAGVPSYQWFNTDDSKLYVKTVSVLPASATDGVSVLLS